MKTLEAPVRSPRSPRFQPREHFRRRATDAVQNLTTGSAFWVAIKIIIVSLVVIAILLLAGIGLLYSIRGTPVKTVHAPGMRGSLPSTDDPVFRRSMELFTSTPLLDGNRLEIFTNGNETYPRLWADLRSATHSLTVQMYYCNPGRMADTMKAILIERARSGVRVLFLHDAFGSSALPESYFDELKRGGVEIARFRPVHWYSLQKAQERSHIRVVVVDGRVGYTGGFGLDDKWFGNGHTQDQWRDSNVRFVGPAVMQLQATFASGWAEATGELITGDMFFPTARTQNEGPYVAGVMHTAPTIGSTPAERYLALSIAGAHRSLYITNSYFVPDDDFRDLLKQAAKRGVDVRILTAGPLTDVKTTWYAGRARYAELLNAGIRIWEYQPTMMHAKTIAVDGRFSSVGTMNFDNRSLAFNDESNLNVLDTRFGAAMDSIFLADLRYSKEITLPEFSKRSWTSKLLEQGANLFSRLL